MTAFFMLSGFSLYLADEEIELNWSGLRKFYIKRITCIMPLYFAYCVGYLLLFPERNSLREIVVLLPTEVLGIQSFFSTLFGISHNGGTWFISCILFCYFLYPLLLVLIKGISRQVKIILCFILIFVMIYAPFVVIRFGLHSIYENPLFRCMEFALGIIYCYEWKDRQLRFPLLGGLIIIVLENIILIVSVTLLVNKGFYMNDYMAYNIICLPILSIMLITYASWNLEIGKVCKNIILFLSSITYAIFLATDFSWLIMKRTVLEYTDATRIKLPAAVIICVVIATAMHLLIEKSAKKILSSRFG